jgi:hypothetical protein
MMRDVLKSLEAKRAKLLKPQTVLHHLLLPLLPNLSEAGDEVDRLYG